jgi:hypothetical protein
MSEDQLSSAVRNWTTVIALLMVIVPLLIGGCLVLLIGCGTCSACLGCVGIVASEEPVE